METKTIKRTEHTFTRVATPDKRKTSGISPAPATLHSVTITVPINFQNTPLGGSTTPTEPSHRELMAQDRHQTEGHNQGTEQWFKKKKKQNLKYGGETDIKWLIRS